MKFKVNSVAGNVVIGVAMIPALALLVVAFNMYDRGSTGLALACGGGFLAILLAAGGTARKLSREIEVSDTAIREERRGVEIRWDEPHELFSETRIAKNKGITVTGSTRFQVRTPDGRLIKFSTIAPAGMVGLAAKMPAAREMRDGHDAVLRATELSTAAQVAAARARLARGESVAFGPIAVTATGVQLRDVQAPRDQVRVTTDADFSGRGRVGLHIAGGKTHHVPLAEVPNVAVLDALLGDRPS